MWNFDIAMGVLTCAGEALHWSIPFNKWKIWHSYVRIPHHYVKFVTLPGHKYDIAMSQWHNCAYRCEEKESVYFVLVFLMVCLIFD